MTLQLFQVDAFTNEVFGGNPAAVCPLTAWLRSDEMQNIAMENNLAETAFYCRDDNGTYTIRWFTPTLEVDLCGHATLAAAHVMFNHQGYSNDEIVFKSRSGALRVLRNGQWLKLDFPTDTIREVPLTSELVECFDLKPNHAWRGKTDFMLIFENEEQIRNLRPDFNRIQKLSSRGIIVTAKGTETDFVSRFFAPQSGINEDPVTGSAHTSLIPYWANRLMKEELTALQVSARGGYLVCGFQGDRVLISGQAKTYLIGEIYTA
ncbi:MAG TPA: PhzF family phenazine biosynthesis protein [Cyclobacteriaceae bacterium]|nr:PhzF family phenazine biosynthesis protein [Cyclobacteriaceae bacterium]